MKQDKHCLECGEIIKTSGNIFCNSSCAAKHNNAGRKYSDETKVKLSVARKRILSIDVIRECAICGNEFVLKRALSGRLSNATTCSNDCHIVLKREKQKIIINELIANGKHKGWEKRNIISYPENFFIEVLKNNNIEFEHNYPIKQSDLGLDNSYNFFLDFYISNKKIDLEIDGRQHNYRKESDIRRDTLLMNNGYNVYRIKWKDINCKSGKEYIENEINKFLEFCKNI